MTAVEFPALQRRFPLPVEERRSQQAGPEQCLDVIGVAAMSGCISAACAFCGGVCGGTTSRVTRWFSASTFHYGAGGLRAVPPEPDDPPRQVILRGAIRTRRAARQSRRSSGEGSGKNRNRRQDQGKVDQRVAKHPLSPSFLLPLLYPKQRQDQVTYPQDQGCHRIPPTQSPTSPQQQGNRK